MLRRGALAQGFARPRHHKPQRRHVAVSCDQSTNRQIGHAKKDAKKKNVAKKDATAASEGSLRRGSQDRRKSQGDGAREARFFLLALFPAQAAGRQMPTEAAPADGPTQRTLRGAGATPTRSPGSIKGNRGRPLGRFPLAVAVCGPLLVRVEKARTTRSRISIFARHPPSAS